MAREQRQRSSAAGAPAAGLPPKQVSPQGVGNGLDDLKAAWGSGGGFQLGGRRGRSERLLFESFPDVPELGAKRPPFDCGASCSSDEGHGFRFGDSSPIGTLATGSLLTGFSDALGRALPSDMDPRNHGLSSDARLAETMQQRSSGGWRRHTSSSTALAPRVAETPRQRRVVPNLGDLESAFESWEAKWSRLLEADEAADREARRASAAFAAQRRAAEQEAQEAEEQWRRTAEQEAGNLQERWRRAQAEGQRDFDRLRERWRAEDAAKAEEAAKANKSPPGFRRACPPRAAVASKAPAAAPKMNERRFATWDDYESAWTAFETKIAAATTLRFSDVPWPNFSGGRSTATAVGPSNWASSSGAKKMVFAALRRWHPDKWQPLLDLVAGADLDLVKRRIKEVTEEVIEQKRVLG